jgi:peptide/nickel transport system substrate-binding protein
MVRSMMDRRALLRFAGAAAAAAALSSAGGARAMGRTPTAGKLVFAVPWPVRSIDPHDLFDPAAALFGHTVFDSLFALDAAGEPYPTLAADLPTTQANKTVLRLREGLMSAKGRRLDADDVLFSIERARRAGALSWWGDFPVPEPRKGDPLALVFRGTDPTGIARTLSSPLLAVVPRGFDRDEPDGTGAMIAQTGGSRLLLRRNPYAARGGSFLDEIVVEQAPDLSGSLRSFEGNLTDVGWLGSGLHAPRPGATPFDMGSVGWIVLHTGAEAGAWASPGLAQRLLDGLPPERLERFALGLVPPASGSGAWGGKPCDLLIEEGSAYLDELARTLASLLSRPGHEVTPKALPAFELARRRSAGSYSLLLGVARPFARPGPATFVALAAAADPVLALEAARRPPLLSSFAPRTLTRTLKLGVLGELRIMGAHAPDVRLAKSTQGDGWDLSASYRVSP